MNDVSRTIRQMVRRAVNARNNCPIKIVSGSNPPKLVGRQHYWTNKSGDEIRYPSAYRRAWGKPIYNASTIRVEVGAEWILKSLTVKNVKEQRLKLFK